MTPESEAELKANIQLLLELVREQQLVLREHTVLLHQQSALLQEHSMILREQNGRTSGLAEDLAWVKAHIANLPQPAEFYELRGRVEEISRRLPTPIAYAPPPSGGRKEPAE